MLLYLLRHAEAANISPDSERPLTAKGRQDVVDLGKLLARQGVRLPSTIWSSPYKRAQETASLLAEAARSGAGIVTRQGLTPEDAPAALLPALAEVDEDLLIVGHNPHLSILAAHLLSGSHGEAIVQFRKCTLMRFERIRFYSEEIAPRWALDWFVPPKLFRKIG